MAASPARTMASARLTPVLAAVAIGLVLGLAYLGRLGGAVVDQLDRLQSADRDNAVWTLSRLEVEVRRLAATAEAARRTGELQAVRRRADILYSRYQTIARGRAYAGLREIPSVRRALDETGAFLDWLLPLVDGDGEALRQALPDLVIRLEGLAGTISAATIDAVTALARRNDAERAALVALLRQMALVGLALIVALALTGAGLLRSWHRAERARLETERARRRLQAVVAASLDAILTTDANGRIALANGAAEAVFGLPPERLPGRPLAEFLDADPGAEGGLDLGAAAGRGRQLVEGRRADGSPFPAEISVAVPEDRQDGFVVYVRDITEQVSREEELVRARDAALAGERAKERLLRVMSHEMRTPLNGITGALEALAQEPLNGEVRRLVDGARSCATVLARRLAYALEDPAAGQQGAPAIVHFTPAEIVEAVAALLGPALAERPISLEVRLGTGATAELLGDRELLLEALLAVADNAVKFTPEGCIRIATQVEQGAGDDQARLRLVIEDTGPGIPAQMRDKVFEPFTVLDSSYTRRADGAGLGLARVRHILRALGGEIRLADGEDGGLRVEMTVPVKLAPAPAAGQESRSAAAPARSLRVLVAEDNPMNRRLVKRLLERMGHEVLEAEDGARAVELARRHGADVVLMDISMPGMDGVQATRALLDDPGRAAGAPIIAVTAHTQPGELARFRKAGMREVVPKPVTRAALAEAIARHVPADQRSGA